MEQDLKLKSSSCSFLRGQLWAPGLPLCGVSVEVRMEGQVTPRLSVGLWLMLCHALQQEVGEKTGVVINVCRHWSFET